MPEITIEEFNPEMTDDTAGVLARAFVTNPLNVAAFGVDQVSVNKTFFRGGLRTATSGYLETDRPENVAFYQRFGFEVTHEMPVLGTRTF
jgi:hypothetical protein